jgi:hypothetical protein
MLAALNQFGRNKTTIVADSARFRANYSQLDGRVITWLNDIAKLESLKPTA